jgi:hypothetical protein
MPLVALSPCVSVVPSAHGFVTGEASGLGRTAIPYRRLSSCSTRAWTVFVGCMLPAAQRRLWLRRRTPLPQDSAATRRPHPLFHRRCWTGSESHLGTPFLQQDGQQGPHRDETAFSATPVCRGRATQKTVRSHAAPASTPRCSPA